MKKIILCSVVFLSLLSCKKYKEKVVAHENMEDISVTEIDGCEYLVNKTYNSYNVFTHKGNCKNKIHQYNNQ